MSTLAKALGLGATYTYQGKEYRLSPWTFGIQADFELYLEDAVRREANKWRSTLSPEEFAATIAKVNAEIAAGRYSFAAEGFREAALTTRHFPRLLHLCLKAAHPEVTLEFCREMTAADLSGLVACMSRANDDPNLPSPAKEPLGQ